MDRGYEGTAPWAGLDEKCARGWATRRHTRAASLSQAFLVVRTPLNFVVALVPPIERMLERRPECRVSPTVVGDGYV